MAQVDLNALYKAMKAVTLSSNAAGNGENLPEDDAETRVDLEKMFLTPNKEFSEEWLNKIQQ